VPQPTTLLRAPSLNEDLINFFFFFNSRLLGYWHCGHSWLIVPASGDSEDDCGEVDEM
jgi:hypothetical protein